MTFSTRGNVATPFHVSTSIAFCPSYEALSQCSRLVEHTLQVLEGTLVAIALKTHTVGGEEDIFPKRGPEVLPGVLYCKCEFRVRSGPHSYQNLNFRLVLYETEFHKGYLAFVAVSNDRYELVK